MKNFIKNNDDKTPITTDQELDDLSSLVDELSTHSNLFKKTFQVENESSGKGKKNKRKGSMSSENEPSLNVPLNKSKIPLFEQRYGTSDNPSLGGVTSKSIHSFVTDNELNDINSIEDLGNVEEEPYRKPINLFEHHEENHESSSDPFDDNEPYREELNKESPQHVNGKTSIEKKAHTIKVGIGVLFGLSILGILLFTLAPRLLQNKGVHPTQTSDPISSIEIEGIAPTIFTKSQESDFTDIGIPDVLSIQKRINEEIGTFAKSSARTIEYYTETKDLDSFNKTFTDILQFSNAEIKGIFTYLNLYNQLGYSEMYDIAVERLKNLKNLSTAMLNLKEKSSVVSIANQYIEKENQLSKKSKLSLLAILDKKGVPYNEDSDGGIVYDEALILEQFPPIPFKTTIEEVMPIITAAPEPSALSTQEPSIQPTQPTQETSNEPLSDPEILDPEGLDLPEVTPTLR